MTNVDILRAQLTRAEHVVETDLFYIRREAMQGKDVWDAQQSHARMRRYHAKLRADLDRAIDVCDTIFADADISPPAESLFIEWRRQVPFPDTEHAWTNFLPEVVIPEYE